MTASDAIADEREDASFVYSRIVSDIRSGSMTTAELAEITRVTNRQVQNWASGASRPQGASRDRLLEVHYIVQQLGDVYSPEGVDIWLHGRNRTLQGARPIELLLAGEFRVILDAVERLNVGAM
jgi:DNA-binding transcriptional regulator YiaG